MTRTIEAWRWSAAEVAARVRHGEISATEVARSALGRLEAVNPKLNAVVEHRPDEIMAQARALDDAIAHGDPVGVLAGVPVTTKVNIDQAGYATTNGLKSQRELVARSSSPVADSLLNAGGVLLGRTNTPAFSYRWFTSNQLHGTTRNPHDARLTLLDALRDALGLAGTKKGCDQGACGACTVIIEGQRVLSCLTLAAACDGQQIVTIEGLIKAEELHPMQAAFLHCDGFQCGYCTPGQRSSRPSAPFKRSTRASPVTSRQTFDKRSAARH